MEANHQRTEGEAPRPDFHGILPSAPDQANTGSQSDDGFGVEVSANDA